MVTKSRPSPGGSVLAFTCAYIHNHVHKNRGNPHHLCLNVNHCLHGAHWQWKNAPLRFNECTSQRERVLKTSKHHITRQCHVLLLLIFLFNSSNNNCKICAVLHLSMRETCRLLKINLAIKQKLILKRVFP